MKTFPRPHRIAALTLAAVFTVGCTVHQDEEVAAYRQLLDRDAPSRFADPAKNEPLSLAQAMALSSRDHERLSIEGERYLQAVIARKRAMAEFLPTIGFAPSYFSRQAADGDTRPMNRHLDARITGGYMGFNAVRSVAELDQAGATVEERRALLMNTKMSLLLDVVGAYYTALRLERQVEVLGNSLAVQEDRVREVEAQVKAGTGRPLDLAQARAQAAATKTQLVQARGDAANARNALAFLIAAPEAKGQLTDGFTAPTGVPGIEELLRAANEKREDIQAAVSAVHAARQGVDAAIAQYYPSVSINLDYFVYRESIPSASLVAALIEAHIPLFTGGQIHQDVRKAWSEFRTTKLNETLLRRQVARQVRTAHEDLATSRERLGDLVVQVQAARDAFDNAADLVRFGRATSLDRLVAQDALLKAQLDQSAEQYNEKVSYLNLQRAIGSLDLGAVGDTPAPASTQPN